MATLDFYAGADDLRELVRFIFENTDIIIYELSSEHNRDPRRFDSLSQLERVFPLGEYQAGQLQLWSPSVMAEPVFRRIEMTAIPSTPFRYAVEGAGLMQLYLSGIREDVIYHTHFGHWNEAGARQRSMHPADDCDWRALSKLSGRIQRHVRGKLARGKLYALPVLCHAFAAVRAGSGLWFGPEIHRANSPNIVSNARVGTDS